MKLGDTTVLNWVVKRTLKSKKIDKIVLATSTNNIDDEIEKFFQASEVVVRRGPEQNVLKRFIQVANEFLPEIVVRVCADNPFVDGEQIDYLVDEFKAADYDLMFNNTPHSTCNYADGFGAEAIGYNVLRDLEKCNLTKEQKEHVTKYIYDNSKSYKICGLLAPEGLAFPNVSLDVNTKSDYDRLTELIRRGVNIEMSAKDIIKVYLTNA